MVEDPMLQEAEERFHTEADLGLVADVILVHRAEGATMQEVCGHARPAAISSMQRQSPTIVVIPVLAPGSAHPYPALFNAADASLCRRTTTTVLSTMMTHRQTGKSSQDGSTNT